MGVRVGIGQVAAWYTRLCLREREKKKSIAKEAKGRRLIPSLLLFLSPQQASAGSCKMYVGTYAYVHMGGCCMEKVASYRGTHTYVARGNQPAVIRDLPGFNFGRIETSL